MIGHLAVQLGGFLWLLFALIYSQILNLKTTILSLFCIAHQQAIHPKTSNCHKVDLSVVTHLPFVADLGLVHIRISSRVVSFGVMI